MTCTRQLAGKAKAVIPWNVSAWTVAVVTVAVVKATFPNAVNSAIAAPWSAAILTAALALAVLFDVQDRQLAMRANIRRPINTATQ
jgi:hypothetical protein